MKEKESLVWSSPAVAPAKLKGSFAVIRTKFNYFVLEAGPVSIEVGDSVFYYSLLYLFNSKLLRD